MTGQQLINQAMRQIGVLASGETPSSNESDDALLILNDVIDSWNTEPGAIYRHVKAQFSLTGAASYTIGSGSTWNTTRPHRITAATAIVNSVAQPVAVVDGIGWSQVVSRSTALFPSALYYDAAFPAGTVYLAPLSTGLIDLFMIQPVFTTLSTLGTTIPSMPPAYSRALMLELAVALAPEYGRPVEPTLFENMQAIKASLGTINVPKHETTPPVEE